MSSPKPTFQALNESYSPHPKRYPLRRSITLGDLRITVQEKIDRLMKEFQEECKTSKDIDEKTKGVYLKADDIDIAYQETVKIKEALSKAKESMNNLKRILKSPQ